MVSDVEAMLAVLQQAASLPNPQVFGRQQELHLLISRTKSLPSIQVIVGPTNAGKSALLDKFTRLWKENDYLQAHRPLFHLDMKSIELRTVDGAARALQVLDNTVDVSSFRDLINKKPEAFSLEVLVGCINKLGSGVKPVWVIDEFQRLKQWGKKDEMDFLTHLMRITKQEGQASVFLSTFDDQFEVIFQNLASCGIRMMHLWVTIGVGFFKQQDAKSFIMSRLGGYELPDHWNMIYEVCGGCPKLLIEVADTLLDGKDVVPVLNKFISDSMLVVQQGFCTSWDCWS